METGHYWKDPDEGGADEGLGVAVAIRPSRREQPQAGHSARPSAQAREPRHRQSGPGEKPTVLPADVRRALDFMHQNFAERIGLTDAAVASLTSQRALLAHFQVFLGISPMQYLRRLRLAAARA